MGRSWNSSTLGILLFSGLCSASLFLLTDENNPLLCAIAPEILFVIYNSIGAADNTTLVSYEFYWWLLGQKVRYIFFSFSFFFLWPVKSKVQIKLMKFSWLVSKGKACKKFHLFQHFAQTRIKMNKSPISTGQALFQEADFLSTSYSFPDLGESRPSQCHPVPITHYWVGMFANCMRWDPSIPTAPSQIPQHRSQTSIACTFSSSFHGVQCGSGTFPSTGCSRHGN